MMEEKEVNAPVMVVCMIQAQGQHLSALHQFKPHPQTLCLH